MILQFFIIFTFLAIGELTVWATGIPVPSSIIGMLLLTASLKAGAVKLSQVERLADFLTRNMAFFFVPAGVGLINCLGLLSAQWLPIACATVGSTFLIIAATGQTHRAVRRLLHRRKGTSIATGI
ncbi:MAG: CidA/LrgA family protein [Pseudoflavonifractor sp.]|nr:CidA/LrgA family protein [Alloprevotella sp.]MCM1116830.1 CidA/LrgA family protein [Pseudoflavonifractor sp.]